MDILFLIALGWCLARAVEHARKGAAESRSARLKDIGRKHPNISKARRSAMLRRHDAGYWAGELVKGFPAARHGFASGWHAHRTAVDEARLARDKARADHEENRASIREQAAIHRRRMAEALKEQERLREQDTTEHCEPERATVTPLRARPLRAVPDPPPEAPGQEQERPLPDDDGWPAGVPRKRRSTPGAPAPGDSTPATRGAPVADTTYDEVLRQARQIAGATESDLQGVRQRKAELTRLADAMQGAEVDPQSLGEMADMIDAHDAAEKALAQAHDAITAFPQAFAQRHGLLNEAHRSSSVPAAQRDFYQG